MAQTPTKRLKVRILAVRSAPSDLSLSEFSSRWGIIKANVTLGTEDLQNPGFLYHGASWAQSSWLYAYTRSRPFSGRCGVPLPPPGRAGGCQPYGPPPTSKLGRGEAEPW